MQTMIRREWQINKYNWMSLAGVLGYMFAAQRQQLLTVPVWVAWALMGLGILESVARCVTSLCFAGRDVAFWGVFYKSAEIALITGAIYVTGGIRSELWLLYFMVMIYHSLYAPPRSKRFLDLYMLAMYLLATLPVQWQVGHAVSYRSFTLMLFTRLFFLILVSALARRVSADTQQRDRELMLLREQTAAGEERARIAREIHDGLGHAMVSAILRLELCLRLFRNAPAEAETLLREELPALRAAWNEGRDMAFHLRPWEAGGAEPLSETLRRHTARFAERTGIPIALQVEGREVPLRPEVAYGLTRIIQEALTNTARHAHCAGATVTLDYSRAKQVTCRVADDGVGFHSDTMEPGVGIQSMRERAEKLGGTFALCSAVDCGTTITVELPA